MTTENSKSDAISIFTLESANSESFDLNRLSNAVDHHFGTLCDLVKIDEGGYHKVHVRKLVLYFGQTDKFNEVYDVIRRADSKSLDTVVRVASSAFPRDKMLSEVRYYADISMLDTLPTLGPRFLHSNISLPTHLSQSRKSTTGTPTRLILLEPSTRLCRR